MAQEAEHGTTEEGTGAEGAEAGTGAGEEVKTFSETYVRQLRGEAGDYRRRLREAEERLAEFENAGKSEVEKLTERVTAAEQAAGTASSEAARLRVALAKGLTESQAKRLVGSTVEELEADAEELLKAFGAVAGNEGEEEEGQGLTSTPRERLRSGSLPASEADETDPLKIADAIRARRPGI